jgi:hypothetical protein
MDGVAAEVAAEGLLGFEQHDVDALSGEQQGQDDTGRPTADYTAVRALRIDQLGRSFGVHGQT